ncbi:MAG: hypothetical protein IJ400_06215 [Clostridia bacterium]|nr:hypothetical protein [Clostridia bacterium]
MILEALKSLYPNASEKVLVLVERELERYRGKGLKTDEIVELTDKLVTAYVISEALKIEDDSKPTCVGNESSFVSVEDSDEIND